MINLKATEKLEYINATKDLYQGAKLYDKVAIELDESWSDANFPVKTVVFGDGTNTTQVDYAAEIDIPEFYLSVPDVEFFIGLIGTSGTIRRTTNLVKFTVTEGSYQPGMVPPSPDTIVYSQILLENGAKISGENGEVWITIEEFGGDRGFSIIGGQLSVGSPDDPRETVLGSGDSYPIDTAFHADIADTVDLTIVNATDITDQISSDLSGSAALFGGTAAGKYILVGMDYKTSNFKVLTITPGVIEPDNIVAEYYENDVNEWVPVSFMATEANNLDNQLGEVLTTLPSEQWRFGFNPLDPTSIWEKATMNIDGVDVEKYWARFRVVSDITTDAIINQVKVGTDRFQIKGNGRTEYFGEGRYIRHIVGNWSNRILNNLKNPQNRNIEYGVGMTGVLTENRWTSGADDGILLPIQIVKGLDTSIPLVLTLQGYPEDDDGPSIVKFGLEVLTVKFGHNYDGNAVPEYSTTAVDAFPAGSQLKGREAKFLVPINKTVPGDKVIISVYRMGNDPEDTTNGDVIIEDLYVEGYFWTP